MPVSQNTEDFGFAKGFLEFGNEDSFDDSGDKTGAENNKLEVYEKIDFSKLSDIEFPVESKIGDASNKEDNSRHEGFNTAEFRGSGVPEIEVKKQQMFGWNQIGTGSQGLVLNSVPGGVRESGVGQDTGNESLVKMKSKVVKKEVVEDEQFLDF